MVKFLFLLFSHRRTEVSYEVMFANFPASP
jgi:hypothetical protein